MQWGYTLLGTMLVLAAMTDAIVHTVALRGGGPMARRLGAWLWHGFLRLHRHRRMPRLAASAGPVILLLSFLLWSLLLWLGWALIFASEPGAVVNGTTRAEAGAWERLYYAGFTITTLGIGDYVPNQPLFKVLTVIAAGMGFFLITLFVTYLLSVLSAVVFKRGVAFDVLGPARTPEQLVIGAWRDGGFDALERYFLSISSDLVSLSQQHLAYPALHYFRSADANASPAVAVTVLDEALTLIEYGLAPDQRPSDLLLRAVRGSIARFTDTVTEQHPAAAQVPPAPALAPLRAAGVPTVSDEQFARALDALSERRAKLHALLHHDGRSWDDIRPAGDHDA